MASPLSHALANVMKRAAIITVAILYSGRTVSPLHLGGVALSIFGSLAYQQAANCCLPAPLDSPPASECKLLLSEGSGGSSGSGSPKGTYAEPNGHTPQSSAV